MVLERSGGLTKSTKKWKISKSVVYGTAFWWLGAFGGDSEEGVWVFQRFKVYKMLYQKLIALVYD